VAPPAQATYYSGGFGTGYTVINSYSYNSTWQPAMDYSVNAWNATYTPVDIHKISGGNAIEAASYSANWYGQYTRYTSSFRIQLNSRVISANCTIVSNCISSVFSHEFGHVFYQADNPPVSSTSSVMREDRNRNSSSMRGPKQYDIDEANNYL
jgi:hypothetical protein